MDESDQADLDRIGRCIQIRFALGALHTQKDLGEVIGDEYVLRYRKLLAELEANGKAGLSTMSP